MLKEVRKSRHPHEVEIAQFLRSEPLASDSRNNCCPIYDILQDPRDDDIQLVIMPLLYLFMEPKFSTVGEAMEFFRQVIEV